MSSYNRILAYNKQTQSWQNVNCDTNGNLVVNVASSGEAGTANSGNQLIQIDKAEIANGYLSNITTKLNGTLTVQLPGGVNIATQELQVDQLDRMDATNSYLQSINTDMATSAKQTEIKNEIIHSNITLTHINSNIISSNVVLSSIKTATELTAQESYEIRSQITPIKIESAYADIITQSATLGADTNPAFTQHPVFDGWYYNNTVSGGASNLYYYANQTGQQKQYTVAECLGSYAICRILTFTNVNTIPFLVIYSSPTGSGDFAPGFYRSRWVYRINNTSIDSSGMEFLMYAKTLPDSRIFPNVRRIPATLISTNGPALETETLQFLTVNTDSSATQNTVSVIYSAVGYNLLGTYHNLELSAGKQNEKVYLADKIALTNQEATQQLIKTEVIATNSALADVNNTLQSIDTNGATSALQTDIKNELITLNNTGLMTDATGQSIDANILLVLDELQNGTISVDISEPLEFDPDDGGLIVHVANPGSTGGDASSANQQTQIEIAEDSNIAICSRLDGSNSVLQTISSNIKFCNTSPLLTESTYQLGNVAICSRLDGSNSVLQDFQTNGVKSLVYGSGFPIDSTVYITGRQALSVSIENNAVETSVNNFPTTYATDANLSASNLAVCNRLETINTSIQGISGGGGNSNVTVLNSNLNTRIFGSHDGTTWHHILTTPQGKILVNSSTQDGNGDNITSHTINSFRGLDSYIINPSIETSNIYYPFIGSIDARLTISNTLLTGILSDTGSINSASGGIYLNTFQALTPLNNIDSNSFISRGHLSNISANTYVSNINLGLIKTNTDNILIDTTSIKGSATSLANTIFNGCQKVSLNDIAGVNYTSTTNGAKTSLDVSIRDSLSQSIFSTSNRLNTDALLRTGTSALTSTISGKLDVNVYNFPTSFEIQTSGGGSLNQTSGALNVSVQNSSLTTTISNEPSVRVKDSAGNLINADTNNAMRVGLFGYIPETNAVTNQQGAFKDNTANNPDAVFNDYVLKTYSLTPKVINIRNASALTTSTNSQAMLGGQNAYSQTLASTFWNSWGAGGAKIVYAFMNALASPKTIYLTYVDSNFDLIEDFAVTNVVSGTEKTLPAMMGLINVRVSSGFGSGTEGLAIRTSSGVASITDIAYLSNYSGTVSSYRTSIGGFLAIPNGYMLHIDVIFAEFTSAGQLILVGWDGLAVTTNGSYNVLMYLNVPASTTSQTFPVNLKITGPMTLGWSGGGTGSFKGINYSGRLVSLY